MQVSRVSKDEKGENGEKETFGEAQKGGRKCSGKNILKKGGIRAN